MAFEKLLSFTKDVSDLADQPAMTAAELKAQFDAAPDEVRQYLNKLIDALKGTTSGDSGAKNIGVTNISGVTGNDVQTVLEGLKGYADQSETDAKTYADGKFVQGAFKMQVGSVNGSSGGNETVTFPTPFTTAPKVVVTPTSFAGVHTRFFIYNVTNTGFQIFHETTDWSGRSFHWMAVGN
jgi:hypothetical protein